MRLGWAVSGQGMILRAVHQAQSQKILSSQLVWVMFDRADRTAPMINYCDTHSIPWQVVQPTEISHALIHAQSSLKLDWLGLTFNRLLTQSVIDIFDGQIFNCHFSLLPELPGFHPTRRALANKLQKTGVSVHIVDAGIDTGPVLAKAAVKIYAGDNVETLGRRQFEIAVPLVLHVIWCLEQGMRPSITKIDCSVSDFSRKFCDAI